MMKRLATLVLLTSGTAAAAPIHIAMKGSNAAVDHVDLALHRGEDTNQGLVYLTLSTQETTNQIANLTFTVPHGTRVVAMSLRNSEGLRSLARPLAPDIAEATLAARMFGIPRDPALLEQVKTAKGRDTYSLRVFPLTKTAGAIVEIDLELPGKLDAKPSIVSGIDAGRVSVAEFEDAWTVDGIPSLVDGKTALYADDPHPIAGRIAVQLVPEAETSPNTGMIRAHVRAGLRDVAMCFVDETANLGMMNMQLVVQPGGRLSNVSVAGASKAATECVRKHVAELSFRKVPDEVTVVTYPLFWLRT